MAVDNLFLIRGNFYLCLTVLVFLFLSSQNSSHYIPFDTDLPFKPITLEIK